MDSPSSKKRRSWIAGLKRPGSSSGAGSAADVFGTPPSSAMSATFGAIPATLDTPRQSSDIAVLTPTQDLDQEASRLILNALERTTSQQSTHSSRERDKDKEKDWRNSGSFGKMSFASMMGGLSGLSLVRTNTNDGKDKDKERGRSRSMKRSKSQTPVDSTESSRSRSRARSQSPFSFRRFKNREREASPTPQAIPMSTSEIDMTEISSPPVSRTSFADDPESGDETNGDDGETDDEEWSDGEDIFDPVTERNTERNAVTEPVPGVDPMADADLDPDPLGEGVNVVVPPEPYFPSTLNAPGGSRKRGPKRRKSTRHEPLPFETSRPVFQRDRCTLTLTQGDHEGKVSGTRRRRYIVASDMSEESKYAIEWGIGTVLRDGDEMLIVTVMENESKVDPLIPNAADRQAKLRSQQERQAMAYILVRQATQLLQRTKLNVKISCQAWHAKNARHMLLDIVDYFEPLMLIVGSRGLGQLQGILLGSTSHYLIQKCSVPVMVARRRLKRPPRRSAHLQQNRHHVSLAEAGIDRVAGKVDEDVKTMQEEIQKEESRREEHPGSPLGSSPTEGIDEADEDESEDEPSDVKVAG